MSAAGVGSTATGAGSSLAAVQRAHVGRLRRALGHLDTLLADVERCGERLAAVCAAGGRVLVAGNGGSAAQAQHLTAELVGRYRVDRAALAAVALTADVATLTALANDYGADALFARQVAAHGRPGDALVLLSTSGRSANLLAAVAAARAQGLYVAALTGARPNPLADAADAALAVDERATATIQEVHQVLIHLLCECIETAVSDPPVAFGADR